MKPLTPLSTRVTEHDLTSKLIQAPPVSRSKIRQKILRTPAWQDHTQHCPTGTLASFRISTNTINLPQNEQDKAFFDHLTWRAQFETTPQPVLQEPKQFTERLVQQREDHIQEALRKDALQINPKELYGSHTVFASCTCGQTISLEGSGRTLFSDSTSTKVNTYGVAEPAKNQNTPYLSTTTSREQTTSTGYLNRPSPSGTTSMYGNTRNKNNETTLSYLQE